MSLHAENNAPLLIAPRPIRVASGSSTFMPRPAPVRLGAATAEVAERVPSAEDSRMGKENATPSPRSFLPNDTLEEFLSILQPSFGPNKSPVVRTHRQINMPHFMQDATIRVKSRMDRTHSRGSSLSITAEKEGESSVTLATFSNLSLRTPSPGNGQELDIPASLRWFSANILSSPVSRTHTRNPFPRQAAYAVYPTSHTPGLSSLPASPLSPSAVPLPSPSPEEEMSIQNI